MRTWLGTHNSGFENFPAGELNAKQVRDLLALEDKQYGSVKDLRAGMAQPILQLTDDGITEIHVSVGFHKRSIWDRHAVFWITKEGVQIAACIQIGSQDIESQKFKPQTVEGYLWDDEQKFRLGKKAETRQYEWGMHGLGREGAVPAIRQYIKETFVNKEDTDAA